MSRKARRQKTNIRRIAAAAAVLLFLIFSIVTVTAKPARAEDAANTRFKYYTTITVESGDTLWSIAETYKTEEYRNIRAYIREVQSLNHLNGAEIFSGSRLVVPYYSDEYKL